MVIMRSVEGWGQGRNMIFGGHMLIKVLTPKTELHSPAHVLNIVLLVIYFSDIYIA